MILVKLEENIVFKCKTVKKAKEFINNSNLINLSIMNTLKQSSFKQREAVCFCENILEISFKGDLFSYYDCLNFLNDYLNEACLISNNYKYASRI